MFGKVTRFNGRWGFIKEDDREGGTGRTYYVRSGDILVPSGFLAAGSHVEFTPSLNDRGRIALNVRPMQG